MAGGRLTFGVGWGSGLKEQPTLAVVLHLGLLRLFCRLGFLGGLGVLGPLLTQGGGALGEKARAGLGHETKWHEGNQQQDEATANHNVLIWDAG